jgi:hypothetical protein
MLGMLIFRDGGSIREHVDGIVSLFLQSIELFQLN